MSAAGWYIESVIVVRYKGQEVKIQTILKITDEWEFKMARNAKDSLCVFISGAVRSGNVESLADLIDSRKMAVEAIEAYQARKSMDKSEQTEDVA